MGLSEQFVQPAIAVTDLARARGFYEGMLGLSDPIEEPGGVRYRCGAGSRLFVYESPGTAGKAEHTVAGWDVDDLATAMRELRDKGVRFEHYDEGTPTDDDGVFTTDTFRAAWLRDPDGNTIALQESFEQPSPSSPVVHVEVRGADPDALRAFYAGLAGWTFDPGAAGSRVVSEVSEPGRYGFVERTAAPDGSGVPAGVGGGTGRDPYAIFYIGVPDVAVAVRRATELGGTVVLAPESAEGRDLAVAHVRDPEGNLVGLAGPAPH